MDSIIFLVLLLTSFFAYPLTVTARSLRHDASRITVVGAVYCDTCSSNAFTKHSYFLPGVDVQIRCKFKVNSPKSTEQVNYLVNKTTDKFGVYKLDIPSVEGVNCINGLSMVSMCQASLIGSSSSGCNVPVLRTSSDEISIKSEQDNLCIYSLNALSYKPSKRNTTLCGNKKEDLADSLNSSKCFFPWPPLPQFHFPPLPPFPSLPFPTLPWPFQNPPSLPFPFPPLPSFPPTPSLFSPTPPPPPPAFSLTDPRTWIPYFPPSPPDRPQNHKP
ncbi:Pollen Ole e 1 allergen and extensin family protein [Parasponia andersonii]|uniref:Pollen Ole e 1 allergen and extensin family protein n=1 Tax=Parasponia andersonii TaxID=3476 RepID=A0A2P5BT06_PARAD|nr:Pollen Ole e 1 allergen and extensin family protein [Parasponia andersonii]